MKNIFLKLAAFAVVFIMGMYIVPSQASADTAHYDLTSGVLTIYDDTGMNMFTGSSDPVTTSSVTSIIINDGVTFIGNNAFSNYYYVTSVTIPATISTWGTNTFYDCNSLTSITLSEGLTTIGDYAFMCCHHMGAVTLPSSLESIGKYAIEHWYINLTSLSIPSSVTAIGDHGLARNTQLTEVTFNSTTPPSVGTAIFYADSNLTTIYVPSTSVDAYKAALPAYADLIVGFTVQTEESESTVSDNNPSSSTVSDNNPSSSSSTVSDNNSGGFHWEPTTVADIFSFSKRSSESVSFKSVKTENGDLTIANDTQGELFMDSVNTVLDDYTIGYTYNAFINSHIQRNFGGNYTIVIDIPESLQADGRVFKIIAVDENGVPITYTDEDLSTDTITFTTSGMYAFALCYK